MEIQDQNYDETLNPSGIEDDQIPGDPSETSSIDDPETDITDPDTVNEPDTLDPDIEEPDDDDDLDSDDDLDTDDDLDDDDDLDLDDDLDEEAVGSDADYASSGSIDTSLNGGDKDLENDPGNDESDLNDDEVL